MMHLHANGNLTVETNYTHHLAKVLQFDESLNLIYENIQNERQSNS